MIMEYSKIFHFFFSTKFNNLFCHLVSDVYAYVETTKDRQRYDHTNICVITSYQIFLLE